MLILFGSCLHGCLLPWAHESLRGCVGSGIVRSWCICVQPRRRACVGACVCECVGACVQVGSASCGFGINCNYGTQACKQCIIVTAVLVYKYYNIRIMYNPYINLCMYIFNNVDHVSLPRRLGWFFKQWSSRSAALLKEVLSLHTSTKQENFPLSVLQSTTAGWSHRTWRARLFFVEKDLLHSPRSHTKSFAAGDSTADRHDVDTA